MYNDLNKTVQLPDGSPAQQGKITMGMLRGCHAYVASHASTIMSSFVQQRTLTHELLIMLGSYLASWRPEVEL
eukprot:365542-Chlamydomonas_euryale.AAC.48